MSYPNSPVLLPVSPAAAMYPAASSPALSPRLSPASLSPSMPGLATTLSNERRGGRLFSQPTVPPPPPQYSQQSPTIAATHGPGPGWLLPSTSSISLLSLSLNCNGSSAGSTGGVQGSPASGVKRRSPSRRRSEGQVESGSPVRLSRTQWARMASSLAIDPVPMTLVSTLDGSCKSPPLLPVGTPLEEPMTPITLDPTD